MNRVSTAQLNKFASPQLELDNMSTTQWNHMPNAHVKYGKHTTEEDEDSTMEHMSIARLPVVVGAQVDKTSPAQ